MRSGLEIVPIEAVGSRVLHDPGHLGDEVLAYPARRSRWNPISIPDEMPPAVTMRPWSTTWAMDPRQVRIAIRYAFCMTQFVTRLDDRLAADVDALVADGIVANRSEAVRLALKRLVDEHRRRQIGAEIAAGYRRQPQTDDELIGLDRATRALIEDEPW